MTRLGTPGPRAAGGATGHAPNGGGATAAARRAGVRAGEDKPANEPEGRQTYTHPHLFSEPTGQLGIFSKVDDAVAAATEAQKKLVRLSLDDRDAIVKLIKALAKQNAQSWGQMELDETKIGRLDHK